VERSRALAAECASRLGGAVEPHAPQMVACALPPCDAAALQTRLLERHAIEVVVRERRKQTLVRASFHVYNEQADLDRLVDAVRAEI
jgi:selenocysteine lyase/cysteine desulfurase